MQMHLHPYSLLSSNNMQKQITYSTKYVEEIDKKLDEGFIIPNSENPYFDKIKGI